MMWYLIISPRVNGGRGPGSSSCSLSWRRQCCPADRKCTEGARARGAAPGGWGCVSVCLCWRSGGRQEGQWKSFVDGTKTKRRPKEEEIHTKRTDQWAERSFLLDEPMRLHRPCSTLCPFWQPTSPTKDLFLRISSVALSYCHVGTFFVFFFKL